MPTSGEIKTTTNDNELKHLKQIRIQFSNSEEEKKGLYTLMVSGMPSHISGNVYIVNDLQRKMLDEKKIIYNTA